MANKYDPYGDKDDTRPGETGRFTRPGPSEDKSYSNFDTEKFYGLDEEYKKEKRDSYSYYSDYNKDKEESNNQEDPADEFFASEEKYFTDGLTSEDVEKIYDAKAKKSKMGIGKFLLASLLGAILGLGIFGLANYYFMPNKETPATEQSLSIQPTGEENVEEAVYEKAKDSVVGITTVVPTQASLFNMGGYMEGVGSGVIVSEDGYILTNSHVVSDGKAENINVVLQNQESYEGKLVWYEPEMDLAVVKIEAEGLTPVELADSDQLKVGQKAIAIGNPLGMDLQSTLTSGYISGLDRSLTMENGNTMDGLVQTDAAINSGNSGGALLDSQGRLIGINTAKASADNIGFAIPINTAMVVIERIEKSPDFEPVKLGVSTLNLDYIKSFTKEEFSTDFGIMVMEVVNGSPADRAGIQKGDIITSINGIDVKSNGILRTQLLAFVPGDEASIEVMRGNEKVEVNVKFVSGEL